jgi:hypothetical protein
VLLDRGFFAGDLAAAGLMSASGTPEGTPARSFSPAAFGWSVRQQAQNVSPATGSRRIHRRGLPPGPARYGEGTRNWLQIAGELHVKSGKVLDRSLPPADAPLE